MRITKWSALAVFLFTCAFAPWGWTVTAAVVVALVAWQARKALRRPPAGRHAGLTRLRMEDSLPVRFISTEPLVRYAHHHGRHVA